MTRAPYNFGMDGQLATIKQHSIAKHQVLRTYLLEYFRTLVTPAQDVLRLTLVDGFAGGGCYAHESTGAVVLGSPFIFLESVKEAEALINLQRDKPLRIEANTFFVEKEAPTCRVLEATLRTEGYGERLGSDIHVLHGAFNSHAPAIVKAIHARNPRSGRSIFFLDQYGYNAVPAPLIRSLFSELPAAEVILTFNVDSFITYANDATAANLSEQLGIPDIFQGRSIQDIKANERDFRLFIQSCLYQRLVESCGAAAAFYTVFFIRTTGHGDYWLVHLSQHPRARDVMTRVHWMKNNNFIHYGGAGIHMFRALGYSPARDEAFTGQSSLGFCFDEPAATSSVSTLMEQLPRLILARPEGLSFGELFAATCNTSPADSDKYKQALATLAQHKEIQIVSAKGSHRHSASTIVDGDRLVAHRQRSLVFGKND